MSARLFLATLALFIFWSQTAHAAPPRVTAWYMYGTTANGLESNAYNHGCTFANQHPGGTRVMMLDFGAARKVDSNTWGAISFSDHLFSNSQILGALKAAADGHHNCYQVGETTIVYGNSNYHMNQSGMDATDAYYAGYYQSERASDLASYQYSHGYNKQAAASGSDMEPSWNGDGNTRELVNGAYGRGFGLYYNYGSADGCPQSGSSGSCNNGWSVGDVAYVSYHGSAVPLPEIYYSANPDQWTVVRRNWDNNHTYSFVFWGTTGSTGVSLTPAQGWNAIDAQNPSVLNNLICFGC